MSTQVHSAAELQELASTFARSIKPGDRATVVTLSGELGAGKTTFTQGLARALGVQETVSSPTFVLEKIYPLSEQAFARLIHIDAYRLKSEDELQGIGWVDIEADPQNLIVLEWPERVPALMPEHAISIRFDIDGDGRIITITYGKESGKEIH